MSAAPAAAAAGGRWRQLACIDRINRQCLWVCSLTGWPQDDGQLMQLPSRAAESSMQGSSCWPPLPHPNACPPAPACCSPYPPLQLRGGLPGSVLAQEVSRQLLAAGQLRRRLCGAVQPHDTCAGGAGLQLGAVAAGSSSSVAGLPRRTRQALLQQPVFGSVPLAAGLPLILPPPLPPPPHPQWWPRCGRRTRL